MESWELICSQKKKNHECLSIAMWTYQFNNSTLTGGTSQEYSFYTIQVDLRA